jgi:protein-tyrosine phosphatase
VGEIPDRCRQLSAELTTAGIDVRIVSGAETSLVWALGASDEQLVAASYDGRGGDLLVETPADVSMIEELLYRIRLRGIRVTLAHPERSRAFQSDQRPLRRLPDQGILLQVNAGALLVKAGSRTRQLAEQLCREGLAHALASDGHRAAEWRPVGVLAEGADALAALVGPDRARWMLCDAPAAIIAGAELPAAPPIQAGRRRRWPLRRR